MSLLANKYLTNSESKSILDIHHATVTLEYTVCEEETHHVFSIPKLLRYLNRKNEVNSIYAIAKNTLERT